MTATATASRSRFFVLGPITYAILRIGGGLLFMQHGAQKLFGVFGGSRVELVSQMGLAGVLEFAGGLMIAVGLLTRPVAIVLVALMIAAYFIAHAPQGGVPVVNGGELAILYALLFAAIAANGPGRWSFDGRYLPRLA